MLDAYFPLYILIFFISLTSTALIEKRIIPLLSKSAKQPIYDEGPRWHLKKSGTPTMGGLAFLISASASLLIAGFTLLFGGDPDAVISLMLCIVYSAANAPSAIA